MEKEKLEIINNVISIASKRDGLESMIFSGSVGKIHKLASGLINPEWEKLNDELSDYMLGLEEEDLIMLETIMFIGRDGDEGSGKRGLELYESVKSYTKSVYHDKEGAVDYMTAKGDYGAYLKNGLSYL